MSPRSKDLPGSLANLKISTASQAAPTRGKAPVADSWDDGDEDASSGEDPTTPTTPTQTSTPAVPPPTPASPYMDRGESVRSRNTQLPTFSFQQGQFGANPGLAFSEGSDAAPTRRRPAGGDERRPDKSAAAASRLIAGALGVRAPKMTSEQREYEKAVREREKSRREEERNRRDGEKARQEADERGKLAAWED